MTTLTWMERRQMKRELRAFCDEMDWEHLESYYTDPEYISVVSDILAHPVFQSMENYVQHGNTSTRDHCIQVSYFSYNVARKLGLDYVSCARAGLLHDMFLYDWHDHTRLTGDHFHGLTHPRAALNNAKRNFKLNPKEMDTILKHMWPLTIVPPKYMEGYVVSYADKYCTVAEVFLRMSLKLKRTKSA